MKTVFFSLLSFFWIFWDSVEGTIASYSQGDMVDKFVLIGRMKAKPDCEALLEETLQALSTETHTEPGCLFYALHRDANDPAVFVLIEGWMSKEALEAHFTSTHFLQHIPTIKSLLAFEPELTYLTPISADVKGRLL